MKTEKTIGLEVRKENSMKLNKMEVFGYVIKNGPQKDNLCTRTEFVIFAPNKDGADRFIDEKIRQEVKDDLYYMVG